ncbi:MAG: MaoC family dehydratase N-terminal domain-containing protein [Deltaproteobacteria bacterium]|nr:MaoC family dehydratase N-terminal domain-containing protein [Deltaproteobacteria bacterium]
MKGTKQHRQKLAVVASRIVILLFLAQRSISYYGITPQGGVIMADKTKLGYTFPPYTFVAERGKMKEFAMAISQKENEGGVDPLYVDKEAAIKAGYTDIIATPTFTTCCAMWGGGGLMKIVADLGIDIFRLLHGEESYEYFAPIHPGDVLTSSMKVVDIYQKEKKDKPGRFMDFTLLETTIKNQAGTLVMLGKTTVVER